MTLRLEDARSLLLAATAAAGCSRQPLSECWRRVLAEDITADMDFPPFDRSPLDGYAVRREDTLLATAAQPVMLTQVDYVPAGQVTHKTLAAGQAIRIMTGAPVPQGADAVIRLEDVTVQGERVAVFEPADSANICRQGEEIRCGSIVLGKGTYLEEGALGLLAMLGYDRPLVYDRPKVAILATGSELIQVGEPLAPGKIRNSNNYMLMAKVREAGAEPVLLGHVKDDLTLIEEKLSFNPAIAMYITTGGASVGDYDLMGQLFERLQVAPLFTRLAMKPGMPVLAGQWQGALLVALSGNPASANVSFETLLRPVLRKMAGAIELERPVAQAVLQSGFKKSSATRRFIWARCQAKQGCLHVWPLGFQGNGMLAGMVTANALLDIPAGSGSLEAGTMVNAWLLV